MNRQRFILLLFLICLIDFNLKSQTCIHTDLSKKFDIKTTIQRFKIKDFPDSCIISAFITSKSNSEIQRIIITSNYLLGDSSFILCDNVRSYITNKNINVEVADNDFGDLIVADFNFDGYDDFAIKREEGGNGGPLYNFYIQIDNSFHLDEFFSNTIIFFPTEFDKNKKTLITLVHANAYQQRETTYKLKKTKNKKDKWVIKRRRLI